MTLKPQKFHKPLKSLDFILGDTCRSYLYLRTMNKYLDAKLKIVLCREYAIKCVEILTDYNLILNSECWSAKEFGRVMNKALLRKTNLKRKEISIIFHKHLAPMTIISILNLEELAVKKSSFAKRLNFSPGFFSELFKQISRSFAAREPNISDYERDIEQKGVAKNDPSSISKKKKAIRKYRELEQRYYIKVGKND